MPRFRTLLLASALAFAPLLLAAAQAQHRHPAPPPPAYPHHWHRGDRYFGHRHVEHHWRYYRLPPPPHGTVWVRQGGGFLLLDGRGIILRVWGP
ncbi:MAG TPA: RcnB family protein [Acidocella sp.]|nr:RcnB family protein [Acidocella sp.]